MALPGLHPIRLIRLIFGSFGEWLIDHSSYQTLRVPPRWTRSRRVATRRDAAETLALPTCHPIAREFSPSRGNDVARLPKTSEFPLESSQCNWLSESLEDLGGTQRSRLSQNRKHHLAAFSQLE